MADLPRFMVKEGTRVLRYDEETKQWVGREIVGEDPHPFGGAIFLSHLSPQTMRKNDLQ